MTGTCWQGQRHLPGIRRRDGSLWCARCGVQIQPPSRERAWGNMRGCDAATVAMTARIAKGHKLNGGPVYER
jgi:hypothetical protein